MNKRIILLIVSAGLFAVAGLVLAAGPSIDNPIGFNNFCELLTNGIIPAVSVLIGSIGVIMIIVAGILFMISAGSPEKIKTAKTALLYAIIGILIGVSAGAIITVVKSILNAAGGGC